LLINTILPELHLVGLLYIIVWRKVLLLLAFEPRFIGRSARSLVTIQNELSWLIYTWFQIQTPGNYQEESIQQIIYTCVAAKI